MVVRSRRSHQDKRGGVGLGAKLLSDPTRVVRYLMTRWKHPSAGELDGRLALVTGASSGIGLAVARVLAQGGATVVLGCRDQTRSSAAMDVIRRCAPRARLWPLAIDLGDLESVRRAAQSVSVQHERLDILVNNAGVFERDRQSEAASLEVHFAVNHLGHFALTGLLLPQLLTDTTSRVVTVTSSAHRYGELNFEKLNVQGAPAPESAYARSKLANLMFAFELQRRATSSGTQLLSTAAHPGNARTNLGKPEPPGGPLSIRARLERILMTQSATMGAQAILLAAVGDLPPGAFVGPRGPGQMRGYPHITSYDGRADDQVAAKRLWELSEELSGVIYDFSPGAIRSRLTGE